jgi:hypothetical protein
MHFEAKYALPPEARSRSQTSPQAMRAIGTSQPAASFEGTKIPAYADFRTL